MPPPRTKERRLDKRREDPPYPLEIPQCLLQKQKSEGSIEEGRILLILQCLVFDLSLF
jgi:hypothetical protein